MLDVRDLQMVRAIHEQGSLARASRVLGVGQPSLTRSLAALEGRLRGPLFERNRRGVVPTDLGRAVLSESADILERLARLDRHLAEVRGGQVQTLTIAAGAYVIETFAMAAAARMLGVHPAVRLRVMAANWADVPRAVREREASIGLMDLGDLDAGAEFQVEPLGTHPAIFVVRPGHPLLDLAEVGLPQILAWPFIFLGRIPRRIQAPLAAAREAARAAGAMHPAFPALIHESPTVALAALRHGDAVAAVTVPIAAPALAAGSVVPLPWRAPWMAVRCGIIRGRHQRESEAEQAMLDLLRTADVEAAAMARRVLAAAGIDESVATEPRAAPLSLPPLPGSRGKAAPAGGRR